MSNGSLITSNESSTGHAYALVSVLRAMCAVSGQGWFLAGVIAAFRTVSFRGLAAGIPAEATASSVVAMAKAAVSHFDATTCPVTESLSKTRLDRSETEIACHDVSFGLNFTKTFALGLGCF